MREKLRYGDDGTIVTGREQVVGVLFVIGVTALLIGPVAITYSEPPEGTTRTVIAVRGEPGAAPARVPDDSATPTRDQQPQSP